MESTKKVNCRKCIYYYVTWEPQHPNGCKYFGFKTAMMPAMLVRKNSGKDCEAFRSK